MLENQEKMILDNMRLVHYIALKLGVKPNSIDYDDITSVGMMGLVKAASTFDESKNTKFSTYAYRCINNEIFMYCRRANKYANDAHLEDTIANDGNGNDITLSDTIEDVNSNFTEAISTKDEFKQVIKIILNCLNARERSVMLYWIAGMKQHDIAGLVNISRTYVSKIISTTILKVREFSTQKLCHKEVFSVDIENELYKITFSTKDIINFNKIFASLLQKNEFISSLLTFKVICNKDRVIIIIPADLESFSFIAKIIQEIDNFNMEVIEDITLPNTNESNNNLGDYEEDEKAIIANLSVDKDNYTKSKDNLVKNNSSGNKIGRKIKKVIDYIENLDNFTTKELKENFPDLSVATIYNALKYADESGIITNIGRGKYRTNKN